MSAGVSTKQRQQQLRKVMPYPVTKYDSKIKKPPVAMPKTSVKQLQARAKAELASQGGFPGKSDASVDPNLLQNRQGLLIARQKAATDVNFDAHAANARNIENMMMRNQKINCERNARDAQAEVMGIGLSLGSAHAELAPQDKAAMEKRLQQLKSLVGSRSIEAQMKAGKRLQADYARRKIFERMTKSEAPSTVHYSPGKGSSKSSSEWSSWAKESGRGGLDAGFLPPRA